MILHKFTHSPFSSLQLRTSMERITKHDKILLTQDAVYAARHTDLQAKLHDYNHIYCLADDCLARGIHDLPSNFTQITYDQFVELCLECNQVISW